MNNKEIILELVDIMDSGNVESINIQQWPDTLELTFHSSLAPIVINELLRFCKAHNFVFQLEHKGSFIRLVFPMIK